MTDKQNIFLELAVIKQLKYNDISNELKVDQKTLSKWWDELKIEIEQLSDLRKLWTKKCKTADFWDFKKWFDTQERTCHYCKITEDEIKLMIDWDEIQTKRLKTRGRKLEIERRSPNLDYDALDNLVFCCYWCNNAKTDEFSEEEFKPIGLILQRIWQSRIAKAKDKQKHFAEKFVDDIPYIKIIKKDRN